MLPELLQELRPGQGPLVAGHLGPERLHERGGADLGDAQEVLDVAPGEELPVELLELADGVGDGEQPPGLCGHRAAPHRQTENGPPGGGVNGFARPTPHREHDTRLGVYCSYTGIRPHGRCRHTRAGRTVIPQRATERAPPQPDETGSRQRPLDPNDDRQQDGRTLPD